MHPLANKLLEVLDSVGESSQFCAAGDLDPVLPGLEVEGLGRIGVPVSEHDARRLIETAAQAPFGRGEETIVDTDVRRVWQLEPKQFALRNAGWEKCVSGIVDRVREEFGIDKAVDCQLYKLLVYETGSFFAPHRDTEKTPGMFATLVVCLPSRHEGGTLVVTHDGQTREIDFGGDNSEFRLQFAAFYADCRHEIRPVSSGYRICLVYNLAIPRRKVQPAAPASGPAVQAVAEMLPKFFAEDAAKIALPFRHQYTQAELDPRRLKGADRVTWAVVSRAAEQLGYQTFVALLTHFQSGSPDYSSLYDRPRRRYRRFDSGWDDDMSGDDQGAKFEEVYDESRKLEHWVDGQGRKAPLGELSLEEAEIVSFDDPEDWPFEQSISEATGNEGATMERWYHRAVLVVWPPNGLLRNLAQEGPANAVPVLEERLAGAARPQDDAISREFAADIVKQWAKKVSPLNPNSWQYASRPSDLTGRLLAQLDRLEATELAEQFVSDVLLRQCKGDEGPALARLAERIGWRRWTPLLKRLFASHVYEKDRYADPTKLIGAASLFSGLCCSPPTMSAERRAACQKLADEVDRVLESCDAARRDSFFERKGRAGVVEALVAAYVAIDDMDRLAQFVSYVIATPDHYDLRNLLVPAVHALHGSIGPDSPARPAFDRLAQFVVGELRAATATPITPPADWTRPVNIKDCSCADCKELTKFMQSPTESVRKFPRRKELRQHLHRQIDRFNLDLTHETVRSGSPQTLVCTKTNKSYEARRKLFAEDVERLQALDALLASAAPPNQDSADSAPPEKPKRKRAPKKLPT